MISIKNIPKEPGVYLFKDKEKEIIYIGKAKSLKSRISSYFTKRQKSPKTRVLVSKIKDLEYIVVNSEVEALLLENKLIKRYRPKYNIDLKDAKTYAYIKLTNEKFPRIVTSRHVNKSGTFFGPYTDGSARRELIRLVVKLFKLRVCRVMPKRACLNYHIGLCTAPCIQNVSEKEYNEQVQKTILFLKGETKEILDQLDKEMKESSKELKFEVALEKKRQIESIEYLHNKQAVDQIKFVDQDVIAVKTNEFQAVFLILPIKKGVITGKHSFKVEKDDEIFENFIKLYYSQNYIPHEIIVNEKFWNSDDDKKILEEYLSRIKGAKVRLVRPQRGEKTKLIEIGEKNAVLELEDVILLEIQEALNLPSSPNIIECFDVSNLGQEDIVGAMTRWVNGKPDKMGYRKFEIKGATGQNDFRAMHQIVYRRYKKLIEVNYPLPDLIIIDGGVGQLNASLKALEQLGQQIPIISIAKKEEEIYLPKESISLKFDKNSDIMLYLRKIRDSVHKLAISYNRKKRQMRLRKEKESIKRSN